MLDLQLFIRSLKRNKLFSTVNILGLTIGFFTALLIFLFVKGEFTYDQFHEKKERIYRVNQTFIWGEDNPNQFSATGPGVGFAIKQEIQEVEEVTRVFLLGDIGPIIFDSEGKQQIFTDEVVFGVEDSFLEVFDFDFHYGDPSSALSEPYSVVLKRETAERFFGQNDPLGKVLSMDNGDLYTVTGVLDDLGQNSHFDQASVLISLNSIPRIKSSDDNWMWTMFETFILLRPDADFAIVEEKIKKLPEQYVGTTLSWMGYTYEEYIAAGKKWDLFLHALPDLYLFSDNVYSRLAPTGNLRVVIALIGAAIFLLVLSCINFINLSTASFTARAKDVALRKVIGAPKLVLGFRFFKEALLYAVFSMVLAIVIASLTIPSINQQLDLFLSLDSVFSIEILLFLSLLLLLVSFVTGIYPFVFFNKFQPIKSLKGELKSGRKGLRIRNGMLITQYSVSFLLIISSLTLYDQLNFMLRADVGFKKNNLLVLENVNWLSSSQAFIDELSALTGIEKITHCDGVPMFITQGDQFTPNDPDAGSVPLNFARGDEHYLQALDLQLVMGRSFSESFQTDS
ncbi:MAG: ABC transporter permease, partial [Bacteroidota bacterium]